MHDPVGNMISNQIKHLGFIDIACIRQRMQNPSTSTEKAWRYPLSRWSSCRRRTPGTHWRQWEKIPGLPLILLADRIHIQGCISEAFKSNISIFYHRLHKLYVDLPL